MSIYGAVEVVYYQLTPFGVGKIQDGRFPERLSLASRQVLNDLIQLGGTAEWDELKMSSGAHPGVLSVALKRLVDLGYVTLMGKNKGG